MERTIGVVAENRPGVLSRLSGLMERRGFQVRDVSAGVTQQPGRSRFTFVIAGDDKRASQAVRQLRKMVETVDAFELSPAFCVERRMMLMKFDLPFEGRPALFDSLRGYSHSIAGEQGDTLIVEVTGTGEQLDGCLEAARGHGLTEAVQSGPLAMDARSGATAF
ncbi:MAG: acetolactate synthase small subunit [Synergistaceae bacterium]|nr:acetolactate synthase small subunit [Synergistota bacterium]NLM70377.1 acetolactate synthase small subunit [Synergistaceae bacterium]